jgi:ParB-like chromosome segregation protein Spo0J
MSSITEQAKAIAEEISKLPLGERVSKLNEVRVLLHEVSPFKDEPVDCVLWVKNTSVEANDYNPNSIPAPEFKLLQHSIECDGYTQPIVTFQEGSLFETIDGFHRGKVGKECPDIVERVHGYLPVVTANHDRTGRNDRVAATIRHNRARGKRAVSAMSDIVVDLARRNWSDARIAKELGMEQDEVLRLKQITGLAELFSQRDFSEAWEIDQEAISVPL